MGYKFDPIVLERVCNEVIARKLEGLALFDALIERLASDSEAPERGRFAEPLTICALP